jgi:hypothetical protein
MLSAALQYTAVMMAVLSEMGGHITVGPNVLVSKSRASHSHREVVIAAHPSDPARLMAGSMEQSRKNEIDVVAYRSCDGGRTWELAFEDPKPVPRAFAKPAKFQTWADPAVAYGPDGAVYYATVYDVSTPNGLPELVIVRSRDGGKTWEASKVALHGNVDRPFLSVDCTGGKYRSHVYCHFAGQARDTLKRGLAVSISRDAGKKFGPPQFWSAEESGYYMIPGQGVVLSEGTLVVPYCHRPSFDKQTLEICVRRSNDGGESPLGEPTVVTADVRQTCYWTMPMLAADASSQSYKDRLYLCWSQMTADGQRIFLTVSDDKGRTWSKPTILSDESGGKNYDAVLPAVAVSNKGVIGVSWYDSRAGQDGKPCMSVRFRASVEGGTTWLPSVCVTEVPSRISFKASTPEDVTPDDLLGETAGLAADAGGDFHPLWVDKRSGVLQVYTARVSVRDGAGGK